MVMGGHAPFRFVVVEQDHAIRLVGHRVGEPGREKFRLEFARGHAHLQTDFRNASRRHPSPGLLHACRAPLAV